MAPIRHGTLGLQLRFGNDGRRCFGGMRGGRESIPGDDVGCSGGAGLCKARSSFILILQEGVDEGFEARDSLAEVLPVIDNNLWVGMLLVDAARAAGEAFRADIRVVWLEDAFDFAATAWVGLVGACNSNGRRGELEDWILKERRASMGIGKLQATSAKDDEMK